MMKKAALCLVFVGILFPLHLNAAGCIDQKQQISRFLAEGISRIRIRSEQVASSNVSLEEKQEFKTEAEWVSAWTRDAVGRLTPEMEEKEEGIQCDEIPELIPNVRAQWKPLILLSRKLFISSILSNIEPDNFAEARSVFDDAKDVKDLTESRVVIRRAVFRIRNAMREAKKADIIPES